jgi:hypothetical protein
MIWRLALAAFLACGIALFAVNAPRAQFNGCPAGFCNPPKASSGAADTWDPSNKGASITLSGGNLTATQTANNGTNFSVRSIVSHSTGKYYFEQAWVYSSGSSVVAGWGTSSATVASSGYQIGVSDNNSIGTALNGSVYYRGAILTSIQGMTSGNTMGFAIDIGNQLLWTMPNVNVSCLGNWNNSGTANPATGTGGVSISPSLSGALYIMSTTQNTTIPDSIVLNVAGPLDCAAPVGFGAW